MQSTLNQPNILMLGWELPPHNTGGLGVACYGLSKGLSKHGAKIYFGLPRRLPSNIDFMDVLDHDIENMHVTAINSLLEAYSHETLYEKKQLMWQEQVKLYGQSMYDEAMRFGQLANTWSKSRPHHVVHAHDWMTYPAAMTVAHNSGKPFVAHIHATEFDRTGGNVNSRIAELEYQGLSKADKVIAVSEYTKGVVQKAYSIPSSKIEVIHNGIDTDSMNIASNIRRVFPNDNIILFVGRLTFQKGIEYFLQSAKELLKTHPNTVFLVVGSGDMEERLTMDAAYMGLGGRVIFTGFLSGASLKSVYKMADVFVMPSISEPYGLVALESIAAGTPAVISKQSGVSESLSHVMKVDFWDTHMMAKKIATLLDYPKLASQMVQLSQEEIKHITWDKAAQKTLNVYRSLVN